jgi:hypothetical protein
VKATGSIAEVGQYLPIRLDMIFRFTQPGLIKKRHSRRTGSRSGRSRALPSSACNRGNARSLVPGAAGDRELLRELLGTDET